MVTLDNFYRSNKWQKFREKVIFDRTNDNGMCYCALCGKPITNKIVCHHVEELTEYNVSDPNISLNPDNIELLHIDCHNKIHDRFQSNKKKIVLVYGPPIATLEYVEKEAGLNDFIISLDYIYKALNPQYYLYKHTKAITNLAFNIRSELYEIAKYRTGIWNTCYIVGGFPSRNERERIKKELGTDEEVLIDITKEEAYEIAKKYNVNQQYYKYIDDWYKDFIK